MSSLLGTGQCVRSPKYIHDLDSLRNIENVTVKRLAGRIDNTVVLFGLP